MARAKLVRKLVKTGMAGNRDAFRRVTEQIIQEEREKKHHLLANDLERILYGAHSLRPITGDLATQLPHDEERGLPLLTLQEPVHRLEDVVLSDVNAAIIDRLLLEQHRGDALRSYGLQPANKLLFAGPPGCGKTLTAEVLASELGLPLAIVRIDSVVSSLLGETASNLARVFDFAAKATTVMLFDEFDAIAKSRADTAEHGELKRVVNTFLQMIDAYRGSSILIAATNHEQMLDSAIWRRFDEVLAFELPDLAQIKRLLDVKLRGLRLDFEIDDALARQFENLSHADAERIVRRAAKDMVLSGQEFLRQRHIRDAIKREEVRRMRIRRS